MSSKRIKCIACENMILEITAKYQDGFCGVCYWTKSELKPCEKCGELTPKGTLQHYSGLCERCWNQKIVKELEGIDLSKPPPDIANNVQGLIKN